MAGGNQMQQMAASAGKRSESGAITTRENALMAA